MLFCERNRIKKANLDDLIVAIFFFSKVRNCETQTVFFCFEKKSTTNMMFEDEKEKVMTAQELVQMEDQLYQDAQNQGLRLKNVFHRNQLNKYLNHYCISFKYALL